MYYNILNFFVNKKMKAFAKMLKACEIQKFHN